MTQPADEAASPTEDRLDFGSMPPPRRITRTVTVALMVVTALLAGALAWSLRSEVGFALRKAEIVDVGPLAEAELATDHAGRVVRANIPPQTTPTLSFRRPLEGAAHRVTRVGVPAGGEPRWVVYEVPDAAAGPRFTPPTLVTGRMVRIQDLGPRYRGLARALEQAGGGGWVLLDGDLPADLAWLIGLEALLCVFVLFNVGATALVLRRVGDKMAPVVRR